MKRTLKHIGNGISRIFTFFPFALACIGTRLMRSESPFLYFSQSMSLVPGTLGDYMRRAYYRWTLEHVGANLIVGFGSFFTHRAVRLGDRVRIGQYTIIGRAHVDSNVLISDHVSILSGRYHHMHDENGHLVDHDAGSVSLTIGSHSWIGAGSTVMADIGEQAIVGAGSIVVQPVPQRIVVAGNPAKEIRRTKNDAAR